MGSAFKGFHNWKAKKVMEKNNINRDVTRAKLCGNEEEAIN